MKIQHKPIQITIFLRINALGFVGVQDVELRVLVGVQEVELGTEVAVARDVGFEQDYEWSMRDVPRLWTDSSCSRDPDLRISQPSQAKPLICSGLRAILGVLFV